MTSDKTAFWIYLAEQWMRQETTKEERWYQATGINPNYYVSTQGRAISLLKQNREGWPIYHLKPMPDQHGRLYFKIRQPDKYYTRVYIDEAIATGTPVAVPPDLFDERQRAIEESETATAEARAMRQREEARRLAMWALDYDEDHPDYDHYYKQFLRAIKWGARK